MICCGREKRQDWPREGVVTLLERAKTGVPSRNELQSASSSESSRSRSRANAWLQPGWLCLLCRSEADTLSRGNNTAQEHGTILWSSPIVRHTAQQSFDTPLNNAQVQRKDASKTWNMLKLKHQGVLSSWNGALHTISSR